MYLRPAEWGVAVDPTFCDTKDLPSWISTEATLDLARDREWPTWEWVPIVVNPIPNRDNRLRPKRVRRVRQLYHEGYVRRCRRRPQNTPIHGILRHIEFDKGSVPFDGIPG
eukprot:scaffold4600_cov169-Amphora_coffeaeformis.AAC.13